MPDSPAQIEGQFYIDPDGKLAVVKRDYQTMQVGKTKDKKEKGVVVEEGKPIFEAVPVGDLYNAPAGLTGQHENRVRAMMTIRDRARELLYSERTGEPEEAVESKRAQLRAMHTEFVRRFGGLNSPHRTSICSSKILVPCSSSRWSGNAVERGMVPIFSPAASCKVSVEHQCRRPPTP